MSHVVDPEMSLVSRFCVGQQWHAHNSCVVDQKVQPWEPNSPDQCIDTGEIPKVHFCPLDEFLSQIRVNFLSQSCRISDVSHQNSTAPCGQIPDSLAPDAAASTCDHGVATRQLRIRAVVASACEVFFEQPQQQAGESQAENQ